MNGVIILQAYLMLAPFITVTIAYSNRSGKFSSTGIANLQLYSEILLGLAVIFAVICWIAALKLSNNKIKRSVSFTLWALWLYGPVFNIVTLLIIPPLLFYPFDVRPGLPALVGQTVRDVVIAGGFTIYLLRSTYVKNEYR